MNEKSHEDYLVPIALFLHLSNILVIFILVLLLFRAIGLSGWMLYLISAMIFLSFSYKEISYFLHMRKNP